MKTKLLLVLALGLRSALVNVHTTEVYAASNQGQGLVLNLRCPNLALKLGDEIPVEFVIRNSGLTNYEYSDRNYDRSGRMPEFQLTVASDDGKVIPDPRAKNPDYFMGGLSSLGVLHPSESFTKTIPLNLWAIVKHPGKYTVTGTYRGDNWGMNVESAPIKITILPRTESEMDAYIRSLEKKLTATDAADEVHRAPILMKLAFTCSPKIVPIMLKAMYASNNNYWPAQALGVYVPHTVATRQAIVGMAFQRGLAEDMEYVLHQYGCTEGERQAILKRSLTEATTHLAYGYMAEIYHVDVDNPRAEDRARLARDFPKLKPEAQFFVLSSLWPRVRCPELVEALLPLAKLPTKTEQFLDCTLCDHVFLHLLDLKPEVVRPLILEDMRNPKPLLAWSVLQALPDKDLPELDEILAANLKNPNSDPWKTLPLIERYATGRILPQVIAYYQSARERGWACAPQIAMLRFWLKHDRSGALPAIEKAVNFRSATGCYHTVLWDTLKDSFDTDARQIVRKYVNDADSEVAAEAKRLLALPALNRNRDGQEH